MRAAEEGGEVVVGGEVAVVDEVLAGVLGVVGPRIGGQPTHQPQHPAVRTQPGVRHRLRSIRLRPSKGNDATLYLTRLPILHSQFNSEKKKKDYQFSHSWSEVLICFDFRSGRVKKNVTEYYFLILIYCLKYFDKSIPSSQFKMIRNSLTSRSKAKQKYRSSHP